MAQNTHKQWMGDRFEDVPDVEEVELSPELEASIKSILEAMNATSQDEGLTEDELNFFLEEAQEADEEHAGIQFVLIKMGKALGYDVYIPPEDRSHVVEGEEFASLTVNEIPRLNVTDEIHVALKAVDVVWLHRKLNSTEIKCLFEVENTGSLFSGLPRLAHLARAAREYDFDSYIITADESEGDLLSQLKNLPIDDLARSRTRYILYSDLNASRRALDENGVSLAVLNKISSLPS